MVGYSEVIQFDGLSPFRRCGRDLVEFFNNTGWAFLVPNPQKQQRGSQLGGLGVIRQVELTPASREPVSWHSGHP
jgi:hypothetical protein